MGFATQCSIGPPRFAVWISRKNHTFRVARDAGTREDALYWRAVATARTGDAAEAQRLFVDLLKRFPRASRSGQAATALGWLLLDGGDTAAAARAFERAINDQSPAIRGSAAEGLRRATGR